MRRVSSVTNERKELTACIKFRAFYLTFVHPFHQHRFRAIMQIDMILPWLNAFGSGRRDLALMTTGRGDYLELVKCREESNGVTTGGFSYTYLNQCIISASSTING